MSHVSRSRIQIQISEINAQKLERLCIEQGVRKGVIIDEALTLLFLPPLERPEAVLVQHVRRLEDKLAKLDAATALQADLLVEFIYAWLQRSPGKHPLRDETDDARAGAELAELMRRVADRSNPHIWG